MGKLRTLAAIWLLCAACLPAWAQDGDDDAEKAAPDFKVGSLRIDLNAPTAAAAAIIGSDDIAMTSVRTMSDLSAQLLSGFDENGVLQSGVAFSGQPYYWLGAQETRSEYIADKSPFAFLKRTQFSMATKQIPKDGENGIGLGIALSWQLIAENDIVRADEGYECLQKRLMSNVAAFDEVYNRAEIQALEQLKSRYPETFSVVRPSQGVSAMIPKDAAIRMGVKADRFSTGGREFTEMPLETVIRLLGKEDEFDTLKDEGITDFASEEVFKIERADCDAKIEDHLKRKDSLVLTLAQGFVSNTGKYDDLDTDKAAIYLQYRPGTENGLVKALGVPLIGLVSYVADETVKIDDTTDDKADKFIVGFGTANEGKDQALDFQVSYAKSDFQSTRADAEEFKYSLSYSRKVADGIWLELKAGSKSSDDVAEDSFAGLSLKFSPDFVGR